MQYENEQMAYPYPGRRTEPRRMADDPFTGCRRPTAPAHGGFFQRIAQRLNLTDDQKAQIKTILRSKRTR